MKIYTDTPEGTTVIQNSFIDQYMPVANGEFVKVYLYLLRCANTGRELSLSSIADVFEHTEKDIQRALAYWEKQNLLRLKVKSDGTLISVTFSDPSTAAEAPRQASAYGETARSFSSEAPVYQTAAVQTERRPANASAASRPLSASSSSRVPETPAAPSPERVTALRDQQNLRQLFFIAEQYLQRPLTSSEQNDFIYYYDTLKFSTDLIEYLLEYCISKGSVSRHYMRKVAVSWAEAGITTVLQAKQESNLYNKNFFTIMNAFGIKGRNPALPEQEFMSRWLNEYGFSMDIILEACRRTICQTHQPNFQYADKILSQWHESHVTGLADIQALDQKRMKDMQDKKKPASRTPRTTGNRFNNFSQRDYDYDQLERQLLNQ